MKQKNKKYLILFTFCKIVSGKEKNIICNLQKPKIKFIPNELVEVIKLLKETPLEIVRELFIEDGEIFDSYVDFLIKEDFAFFHKEKDYFPEIAENWESPEHINNAIIEYNFEYYNIMDLLYQLDDLQVKFIEIRLVNFTKKNIDELENILSFSSISVLRSIRIYIPYSSQQLATEIIDKTRKFPVLDSLIFYNYNTISNKLSEKIEDVFFIKNSLKSINEANIEKKYLINSISFYTECKKYNPYYNKKVCIDKKGNIKNCIKNRIVFGNLSTASLGNTISTEEFRDFWYANHDKIIDVQHDELRYNYMITNDLLKIDDNKYKILI